MSGKEERPLVVGAVIVDDEGRAFVHQRGHDRALFPGQWDIPGGHVNPGEDPMDALRREIHEETGWTLRRIVSDLGETCWTGDDGITRRERDFLVEVDGNLSAPCLEHPKHIDHAWVRLAEVHLLMENRAPQQTLVHDIVARGLREAHEARRGTADHLPPEARS